MDLNLDCPEVAPLLDTGCSKTIYHLAYNAQLAPVSPDELEDHLGHDLLRLPRDAAA